MLKNTFRKRLSMLAVILGAVFFGTACQAEKNAGVSIPEEKKLVVYTSHKEEVYQPIIREFEERTGIWVELRSGGTSELLEEIQASKGEFTCDVMFGGGIESYSACEDCFETYTPFTELPIVFIYNNKLVDSSQAPCSWQELFYERWQGNIAFGDPMKSGSSYTMLATMIQVLGMDPEVTLKQFAKALDYNVSEGSGEAVEEVAGGVRAVGLTLEETALKAIAKGADISIVYPKEGTSAVPDGCGIVKGAEHEENAKRFLAFIVGEDVQQLAVDRLYRRSVREELREPSDTNMKILDFDVEWAGIHKEEILKLWAEIMAERGEE